MSPRNSRRSMSSSCSRSSNSLSNPNVFSDEHALEQLGNRENSSVDADDNSVSTSTAASIKPPSIAHKAFGHRDVVSQTPKRTASRASNTLVDMHRSSSTSSHFSMPRSQSPYVGATGPSHPYGMYPQITRTSSIASVSTVRPAERPLVAGSGPEHPYAMYSQNTVPEEDDASLAEATIPLGFPPMGQQYQRRAEMRRNDIGAIVGSDGHVEELPPYTRYPDCAVAKEERPENHLCVTGPAVTPQEAPVSAQNSQFQSSDDGGERNLVPSGNSQNEPSPGLKEKIKQKSKHRICGGLPFWGVFLIIGVLLVGVLIGGIIGGVVARRNGDSAHAGAADALQNSSVPHTTVTSTAFIDGAPLPTDLPVPDVPNGQYHVPMNKVGVNSPSCILDPELSHTWLCMPPMELGITLVGQGQDAGLTLDPYPFSPKFSYGAQPPDLSHHQLNLSPSMDRDLNEMGASLFTWAYYNKLTIFQEEAIQPNEQIHKSRRNRIGQYAMTGDKPWFCWFNETVLEFFIYVNKPVGETITTETVTSSQASTRTSFSSQASTTANAEDPFSSLIPPLPNVDLDIRGAARYPLAVKVKEKRKPSGNIAPYCEQMQILDDWRIVPVVGVAKILVLEAGSEDAFALSGKRLGRRQDENAPSLTCACEWISDA